MAGYIPAARTYTGIKPAPIMAGFSSRGPSAVQPLILKVYYIFVSNPIFNDSFSIL